MTYFCNFTLINLIRINICMYHIIINLIVIINFISWYSESTRLIVFVFKVNTFVYLYRHYTNLHAY